MKISLIFALALVLGLPLFAQAGPRSGRVRGVRLREHLRQRSPMRVTVGQTLSVGFVPLAQGAKVMGALGGGVMDIGAVSYSGGASVSGIEVKRSGHSFTVQAPIGIKIGSAGKLSGTALVKAWLEVPDDPYQIYLDHVLLSSQPVSIGSETPMGITHHSLEIVVPRSASGTETEFQATIAFEISEN